MIEREKTFMVEKRRQKKKKKRLKMKNWKTPWPYP